MLHPDEQRAVIGDGHEIGIHSWIHERNSALPPEDERDLQMRAADKLEEISGQRPVGIRTPSWDFSRHTLAITREMGLLYDSSLMADDDPYELLEEGEPTGIVELPVEWIRDDFPYWAMDRFGVLRPHASPAAVLEVFRREFDGAYADEGLFLLTMQPAHHRPPIPHPGAGGAHPPHPLPPRGMVRNPRRRGAVLQGTGGPVGTGLSRPVSNSCRLSSRGVPCRIFRTAQHGPCRGRALVASVSNSWTSRATTRVAPTALRFEFVHDPDTGDDKRRPLHGTNDDGSAATGGDCSMKGRRGWAGGGVGAQRQRSAGPALALQSGPNFLRAPTGWPRTGN